MIPMIPASTASTIMGAGNWHWQRDKEAIPRVRLATDHMLVWMAAASPTIAWMGSVATPQVPARRRQQANERRQSHQYANGEHHAPGQVRQRRQPHAAQEASNEAPAGSQSNRSRRERERGTSSQQGPTHEHANVSADPSAVMACDLPAQRDPQGLEQPDADGYGREGRGSAQGGRGRRSPRRGQGRALTSFQGPGL